MYRCPVQSDAVRPLRFFAFFLTVSVSFPMCCRCTGHHQPKELSVLRHREAGRTVHSVLSAVHIAVDTFALGGHSNKTVAPSSLVRVYIVKIPAARNAFKVQPDLGSTFRNAQTDRIVSVILRATTLSDLHPAVFLALHFTAMLVSITAARSLDTRQIPGHKT